MLTAEGAEGAGASAALARVDALHTALTQIVLEGGDLDGIAAEVVRVLDLGVVITTSDGRVRASAVHDDALAQMQAEELLDETGRIKVERIGEEGRPFGAGEIRALRVAAGGADLARLVCLRSAAAISAHDVRALERSAAVAALLITHEEAVTAVENKYQGDFLRDVFLRRAGGEAYVAEHADTFGWNLRRPVVVVVAELDPVPDEEEPVSRLTRRTWQERFSAAWASVSRGLDPTIPSVDFSSEVVTLLPLEDLAEEPVAGHRVVTQAVTSVSGDKGGGRRPFSVGVSRAAESLEGLPEAYAQARRAVEVGRRVHGSGSRTFFDQMGLHRLIALVPDARELQAFASDVLGPLAEETTEAVDLRETLQVLLDTNFNVAEAARLQFFHYNTMRYRVSKLERLLGPLSRDPHLRLDVAVALRVLEILV